MTDEELAAGAVDVLRSCHGENAFLVRAIIELGLDLISRSAGSRHTISTLFRLRATALDHEPFDDSVKGRAVIKSFTGEFQEVGDRLRRNVGPKFNSHITRSGVNDNLWGGGVGGFFHRSGIRRIESLGNTRAKTCQ